MLTDKQHITKTLFKRASYAFSGAFIGKVSTALAGIIIARSLGVELFGTYSAIWELVLLCASISETGITIGIQRDGAGNKSRLPELVGNALFIRTLLGITVLFLAYFLSSKVSKNVNTPLIYLFLSIASLIVVLSEPLFSGLLALGQQKIVAAFDSARGIMLLIGVLVLMFFKGGVIAIAILQTILYIVTFIILLGIVLRQHSLNVNFSTMWDALKTTFVYGISGQLFAIYSRLPIIMLAYFTNDKEVGIFTAAARIIIIVQVIGAGIYSRAFLPSLFKSIKISFDNFRISCSFMFSFFFLLGALSCIFLFVLAEPIILILMGHNYYDSISILRILSFALLLIFSLLAPDAAMTVDNKNVMKVIFQIIGPLAGIIIGPFLILNYKAAGAAYVAIEISAILLLLFASFTIKHKYFNLKVLWIIKTPILGVSVTGILSLLIFKHAYIPLTIFFISGSSILLWLWFKNNRSFLPTKHNHM